MDPIVLGIITSIVGLWLGSVEVRLRNTDKHMRKVPTRKEVSSEIEVRMEVLKVMQQEIKEDIKEMKHHLEKLASSR